MAGARFTISPDGKAITCATCRLTSLNPNDVRNRYCGHCHVFHDDPGAREFDCADCGRHIVVIVGPIADLCAACQMLPGWFRDREIARILDPDNTRRPAVLQ
jgi:hypothetical protein